MVAPAYITIIEVQASRCGSQVDFLLDEGVTIGKVRMARAA